MNNNGKSSVRETCCYVCVKCGCGISVLGECSYGCPLDATDIEGRPVGTVVLKTYKHTVELISVVPYVPPVLDAEAPGA